MPKKRRVPCVLWRLFRDRARPLVDTIVKLLPPPPSAAAEQCRWCGGRRCLGCVRGGGEEAIASFLLRPDDPSEYRKLLTRCFVVVGDDAPPLSDLSPLARWSQRQIVLRTIEMLCSENSASGNVISIGYSKDDHSSVAIELLTSSAWCVLLERVGDSVMMYLLKYASIFLPYPCKKHFQVAGLPITKLDNRLLKHSPESHSQRTFLLQYGAQKKRKRARYVKLSSEMEKSTNLLHVGTSLISSSNGTAYAKKDKVLQIIFPDRAASSDESFCEVLQGSSNLIVSKVRKHRRRFSWQRRGHKRRPDSHGSGVGCSEVLCADQDNLAGSSQGESSSSFNYPYVKMPMLCSCCQLFIAVEKLADGTQIQRRDMFYDLESSLTTGFPGKHILNTLKPSVAGSLILLQKLFGLSNKDLNTKSNTCLHDGSFCPGGSTCLYHSMINLLKTLLRKARCCQYSRLLDKHCPPPTSVRDASGNAHSLSEERSRFIKREELFVNLIEHVKRNVLQFDKNFYLQGVGIPQGSIISSLLCSLYYGHLERSVVFPFLEKAHESATDDFSTRQSCQGISGSDAVIMLEKDDLPNPSFLLLRFIDDILFISTSKRQAASFFLRLKRGFRDYNCFMNEEKFGLNFDVGPHSQSRIQSHRAYIDESGNSFLRWSGLLINCTSLEVQADYTRYQKTHLRSALTVRWQQKPGSHLKTKLCDFLRPKCHPIFFDSNINSAAVVRLNIYQVFLLCAMKFHCYVCDLSYICKIKASSYMKMIEESFRHMFSLIKKRMRTGHLVPSLRPVLQLEEGEVEWLGLVAYIRVLERKQSRHKGLLSHLKSKFSKHWINRDVSPQLKHAVDGSHSSSLWQIEY
ncbi:telomerase reverse transcriptase isoform X7 [Rhodamnia argentea]|uniref:Telomerase reverse transcriptase n=1 Tax=Rhodamnia argentea TaxID=178133 RepID=A0ABM3GVA2_9MYRT|nr:telomerase reverse transcriptase isoform X7 [Rhodamnia argentea]